MCLFKYILSIEHDGVDPAHLLEDHEHDANHQRLVDTRILQVRQLEFRALGGKQNNVNHQAKLPTFSPTVVELQLRRAKAPWPENLVLYHLLITCFLNAAALPFDRSVWST